MYIKGTGVIFSNDRFKPNEHAESKSMNPTKVATYHFENVVNHGSFSIVIKPFSFHGVSGNVLARFTYFLCLTRKLIMSEQFFIITFKTEHYFLLRLGLLVYGGNLVFARQCHLLTTGERPDIQDDIGCSSSCKNT